MRATDLARLDWEIRHCGIRPIDILAAALGYGLLLALFVGGAVSLLDWLDGRPHSVIPALMAFLEVLDGGAR